MKVDDHEFPHRTPSGIDRNQVMWLIGRLVSLEKMSRPLPGQKHANDKTLFAREAIQRTQELANMLSGWAIDHFVGLVKDSELPGFRELFVELDWGTADDHRHESIGSQYEFDDELPVTNRRILALLLSEGANVPPALSQQGWRALAALDAGDHHPLLQKSKERAGREQRFLLNHARLRALQHLEYQAILKGRKGEAEGLVAAAYGVSVKTFGNWQRRDLPNFFGKSYVQIALKHAKTAAWWVTKYHGCDEDDKRAHSEEVATWWNTLDDDGNEYRRLQGFAD